MLAHGVTPSSAKTSPRTSGASSRPTSTIMAMSWRAPTSPGASPPIASTAPLVVRTSAPVDEIAVHRLPRLASGVQEGCAPTRQAINEIRSFRWIESCLGA